MFWRQEPCFPQPSRPEEKLSQQVTYIGVPSCGLKKRTPSSVTLANLSRLTIWNLESVQ